MSKIFIKINENILTTQIRYILILFIYLMFAFLAIRKIFFKSGVVGHNWDWSVPFLPIQLIDASQNAFSTWSQNIYGQPLYMLSTSLFYSFYGAIGYLGLSGEFLSKALLFSTIVISGFSMFLLLENILQKKVNISVGRDTKFIFCSAFLGSLFYSLSPYLFNEMIGGASTSFFTYAIFPLSLYFLITIENNDKFIYIFLLSFVLSILVFSIQKLFLAFIVLSIYPVFSDKPFKLYLALFKSYILFVSLNFYWIIVFIIMGGTAKGITFGQNLLSFDTIKNAVPNITDAIVGLGYFRDFFKMSISPDIQVLWYFSSYFLIIISIFSIFIDQQKLRRKIVFWPLLFLASLAFSTGAKEPFGNFVLWTYQHVPIMVLFKSPQHLLFLSTFSLSILLAIGIFLLTSKINEKNSRFSGTSTLFLFILLIIWLSPFLTGNLGLNFLSNKGGGNFVDIYELSPGYEHIFEEILTKPEHFRLLPIPMSQSPYYLRTEYQNEGQGADPSLLSSSKPFILADIPDTQTKFNLLLEDLIYSEKNLNNQLKLLGLSNVKYIILRKDVRPNFGPFATTWDYSRMYHKLKNNETRIKLVTEYEYVSLWENPQFLPHIYAAPTQIVIPTFDNLIPAIESSSFVLGQQNIIIIDQNQNKTIPQINSIINTHVFFQQINPTKYKIKIVNAREPFWLTFSESYDLGWQAYINSDPFQCIPIANYSSVNVTECQHESEFFEFKDLTRIFDKSLPEKDHLVVNGYANGWFIDPNKFGTGENFTITLYFKPQFYMYIGLILSGIVFIGCVSYTAWNWLKGH